MNHASETLAKTYEKHLNTVVEHTKYPNKILAIYL
jgi:hypothetical protein